ncbi:MAG: KH domain-containing protein [Anaerolineae bacterium]|nr:KH domain-containing protein [Anaerolineae bacterium]
MEDLVTYIATSLVNDPSQVKVRRRVTNSAIILELKVAPEDIGRVIGKDGRVANSIRALLRVAETGQKRGKRIILEIS